MFERFVMAETSKAQQDLVETIVVVSRDRAMHVEEFCDINFCVSDLRELPEYFVAVLA